MCGLQITGLENNYDSDFMQGIPHETQKAHEEIRGLNFIFLEIIT